MEHREVIEKLNQLNLRDKPLDIVKKYLKQLGKYGLIITTLHQGKRIIRARLNDNYSYTSVSELSYKPQQFNTTFQRASTPSKTMFYGSIIPQVVGDNEPQTARIIVIYELSKFVRDTETSGEQEITFSAWDVIEDIELVSLIHHKKFERPTILTQELKEIFEKQIAENPNLKIQSFEISEYLANQFAKFPITHHTDYLVSAAYSEIVTERFDGVLYPSVKLAGEGINIAIKPESVKDKLQFISASECTIYKNVKRVFVGNNTQSEINDKGELVYHQIADKYYVSKEFGRQQVGL